jgi:hypothetical protein
MAAPTQSLEEQLSKIDKALPQKHMMKVLTHGPIGKELIYLSINPSIKYVDFVHIGKTPTSDCFRL